MARQAQPKLAVILHCDVVGSTTLVRRDERIAHERIQTAFRDFGSLVERYGGVVNEVRGDALVAEFARASDAVLAALAGQEASRARRENSDDGIAPILRMGIALGEVVIADDTVTGAGVVLAQRLEQISGENGVCISGAIREAVPDRLGLRYASLGDREVKGFDEPVRAYAVSLAPGQTVPGPGLPPTPVHPSRIGQRRLLLVGLVVVLLGGSGAVVWRTQMMTRVDAGHPAAHRARQDYKPSIAVLPFANLSNDPDQDYFSDGLTEDLITDLSRISGLVVIARNSSFAYKGQSVNVQVVGRELGARYVLEGSVRRGSDKLRINAQLVDAGTGTHIWSDRYDREMTDIFALQDEVTRTIVQALAVSLSSEDRVRRERREDTSPDAYDALLRGNQLMQRYNAEDMAQARLYFRKAIALDPRYARAHANLAFTHALDLIFGWSTDRELSISRSVESIETALALDDRIPQAHFARSNVFVAQKRIADATAATRRALEVDPNYADGYAQLAGNLTYAGKPEEALQALETAMRLNPRHSAVYLWILGRAHFHLGRYDEAAAALEKAVERNPGFDQPHLMLAATYAAMGRQEDAEWEAQEILELRPGFSVAAEGAEKPYVRDQDRQRYLDGLRKSGLPG